MSETIGDRKVFSLLEVTASIQRTLSDRYSSSFWVMAEMNKLNHYPYSGHCYPDLVEKKDETVIAQMRATLWKDDYQNINEEFIRVLKEPLKNGIKILFSAKVTFHPIHGLSIKILDIDPSFTLGELEKEKQETIQKLKAEGIFNNNKELPLAQVPQRIAIISVETSKGYSDFVKVIEGNPWGYKFFHVLFPSLLQGDKAVHQMIDQLAKIRKVVDHFDVVAIIRGGGGDVGLSTYNNYELSKAIAQFPIPVATGIGHSTNETVAEMISFKNAITPTELADFLIQKFHNFSMPVQRAEDNIKRKALAIIEDEKVAFGHTIKYFQSATQNLLVQNRSALNHLIPGLRKDIQGMLTFSTQSLVELENIVRVMNPVEVLKRGYTLTLLKGKAIRNIAKLKSGDELTTMTTDGTIISDVKLINKSER